jgi:hypothetical protein
MTLRRIGWSFTAIACLYPLTAGAQQLWTAAQDLLIDGRREVLVAVGDIVVGPRGTLWVKQAQDRAIVVYDSAGQKLHVVGRRGSGPGEFQTVTTVGLSGDQVWAFDKTLGRVSFFERDGSIARTDRLPTETSIDLSDIGARPAMALTQGVGYLVRRVGDSTVAISTGVLDAQGGNRSIYASVSRAGGKARVIASMPVARFTPPIVLLPPTADGRTLVGRLLPKYFQFPVYAFSASGDFVSFGDADVFGEAKSYATVMSASGDTLYSVSVPAFGIPLRSSERDSAFEAAMRAQRRPEDRAAIAAVPRPTVVPPLRQLLVASDGGLMLVFNTDGTDRDILTFDRTGRVRIRSRLPAAFVPLRFENDRIWGVIRDHDDVESIVRFSLRPH